MRVPLRETAFVVLNGSGAGTAKVGPISARETWYPDNVHISVATAITEAHCSVYMGGDTSAGNFRDESVFASSGDSSGTCSADVVRCGQFIWAVWTGGDANQRATLTVTGVKDV
jgi:hypothetical protein